MKQRLLLRNYNFFFSFWLTVLANGIIFLQWILNEMLYFLIMKNHGLLFDFGFVISSD